MIAGLLTALLSALGTIGAKALLTLASEKFIIKLLIFGAEKLAKYTTNTIDDEFVAELKKKFK